MAISSLPDPYRQTQLSDRRYLWSSPRLEYRVCAPIFRPSSGFPGVLDISSEDTFVGGPDRGEAVQEDILSHTRFVNRTVRENYFKVGASASPVSYIMSP